MVRKLIGMALDNPLVVLLLAVTLAAIGFYSFLNVNVEAYPDPAPAEVSESPAARAEAEPDPPIEIQQEEQVAPAAIAEETADTKVVDQQLTEEPPARRAPPDWPPRVKPPRRALPAPEIVRPTVPSKRPREEPEPERRWLKSVLAAVAVPAMLGLGLFAVGVWRSQGEVSGTVRLNGAPLPFGRVTFTSVNNPAVAVFAPIREDGSYTIRRCPMGTVKITVQSIVPRSGQPQGKRADLNIPLRYVDAEKSDLELNIIRRRQTHDIDLKAEARVSSRIGSHGRR
jgi:hypothetical protein